MLSKGVRYRDDGSIESCVFCGIVNRTEPARIIDETEEFIVFRTLKPYAKHHLLVCPKKHVTSVQSLKGEEDAEMVRRMVDLGNKCLGELQNSVEGKCQERGAHKHCFHVPPYNSIDHLHLHSIGNGDTAMSWFGRLKYWDSTFYCKSAETIIYDLLEGSRSRKGDDANKPPDMSSIEPLFKSKL